MIARLALLLTLAGCITPRPDAAKRVEVPASDLRIRLDETVLVSGVPLRFDALTEDSRCPPDAQCVWAGRATIRLRIADEAVGLAVPGIGPNELVPSEAVRSGLRVRVLALTPKAPSTPGVGSSEPLWVDVEVTRA